VLRVATIAAKERMMGVAFELAVKQVLKHEGGYVNDPHDPGGETNFGIAKRFYPDEDIRNLTEERAKEIYFTDFWTSQRYNEVEQVSVATVLLVTAVNIGPVRANKILQQSVRIFGYHLKDDGKIGPKTLSALNNIQGACLVKVFRTAVAFWYRGHVKCKPERRRYLKGWLNRVYLEPL
jgi:lysozyme family protein